MTDDRGAALTFIEDLPARLREPLQNGFRADFWYGDRAEVNPASDDEDVVRAFQDGERLGQAVSMLLSADWADYKRDSRSYSELADELNGRYGAGLVVGPNEFGPGGPRPGFRTRGDHA